MATEGNQPQSSNVMAKVTGVLGFLIGIFGACAILGVFFKIIKFGGPEVYETFMAVGFLGEAGAFIIMGLFSLVPVFTGKKPGKKGAAGAPQAGAAVQLADGELGKQVNDLMGQLKQELDRFGSQVREMSGQMQETRSSLASVQSELSTALDGDMAADAQRLGEGIRSFSAEMTETGSGMRQIRGAISQMRAELDKIADGEFASSVEDVSSGMREFGYEIHELGAEMKNARTSVNGMRAELDKVVSGDLAGDAEQLGTGVRVLGSEMQDAGSTVKKIRADLDQMAQRFHLFNDPFMTPENGKKTVKQGGQQ